MAVGTIKAFRQATTRWVGGKQDGFVKLLHEGVEITGISQPISFAHAIR